MESGFRLFTTSLIVAGFALASAGGLQGCKPDDTTDAQGSSETSSVPTPVGTTTAAHESPVDETPLRREAPPPRPELTGDLFAAINANDEEAAMELVRQGAPIDAVSDPRGVTVLHRAAQSTMPNLTRLLLEYGADIDARIDGVHHQPIHWVGRAGSSFNPNRPEGAAEATVDVLLLYGADINATTERGVRPIDYAIELQAHEWEEFLVSRGARR